MKCYFAATVQACQGTPHSIGTKANYENDYHSQTEMPPTAEACLSTPGPCTSTVGRLTTIGEKAKENWLAIPQHFPFVELDAYVIMPNHVHGIIHILNGGERDYQPNQFKSMAGTLGTIISHYKGSLTRYANLNNLEFKWHPRHHDKIVRTNIALHNIRNYIINNPAKWIQKYQINNANNHQTK